MGIHVRPGAAEAIVASPQRFALQIEGADDVAAALAALRLIRVELVGLSGRGRRPASDNGRDGGAVSHADVSPAVAGPAGPLVLVQHLDAAPGELDQIPDLVASRLAEAGVGTATIAVPEPGGRLDALERATGCVALRLFPVPRSGATIPARWLDVAVDWIVADLEAATVTARVLSVEHDVAAGAVADLLHDCGVARAWCDLVTGDPADRIRSASLTYGRLPHLTLGAGGPGVDRAGLVARFELLRELARELADDVGYACLDFEPDFGGLGAGLPLTGWRARGGASPNRVASLALESLAPDAYPWQLLGPGQWARLSASDEVPAAEAMVGGRADVALGDPAAWLPHTPARTDAQAAALAWLAPILVDDDELERFGAGTSAFAPTPSDPAAEAAAPDIQAIVLRGTPSPRRSTLLSALELAAWYAHEPHTDAPRSVSPVLAAFVRHWAAGLDDATRQRLKPVVIRLVGTAGDPAADHRRRWAALEWLVFAEALRWLQAAEATAVARALGAVGSLDDRAELGRAVGVLTDFLAASSTPTSPSPAAAPHDEQAGWEAWEAVREGAGWIAASEAATEGTERAVVEAADLQVIEASRRSRPGGDGGRDGGEAIAEEAWQAALRAVASTAWDRAWRAADQLVRDRSGLTIRVEMGRVAKSTTGRSDDVDAVELEVAERAALRSLVDATVEAGSGPADADGTHPWDEAVAAARRSPGGPAWSVVVDGSRAAVGDAVWLEAMAEARVVLDRGLADGATTAARAMAAAVAREVASVAARHVAQRAIDAARAVGADADEVAKAAADALAEIAGELIEAAFGFLDRLVAIEG